MKGNNSSSGQQPQGHNLPHQQSCNIPPPSVPNFTVPPPSMVAHYQPPPNLPQLATQGTPSQDVIMKLLQVQQQQQKRQHHLLQLVSSWFSLACECTVSCKHSVTAISPTIIAQSHSVLWDEETRIKLLLQGMCDELHIYKLIKYPITVSTPLWCSDGHT